MLLKLSRSRAAVDVFDPQTRSERLKVAQRCSDELGYPIPTLVDNIDDTVNRAYAAWPTRIYLLDKGGRVVYAGGLGPFGFKPSELEPALVAHLDIN